jgi:hypothetical protein
MNRGGRSTILLLSLFASLLALSSNYYTAFHLENKSADKSFSPPRIEEHHTHPNYTKTSLINVLHHNVKSSATNIDIAKYFNLTFPEQKANDDPFAPQKRTGAFWTSPKKHQDNGKNWWQHSDTCFAMDNICHASQNQWFYIHKNFTSHHEKRWQEQQPSFELKYMPSAYSRGTWADTRIQMDVDSTSHFVSWNKLRELNQCQVSMVPYHVVLQSTYNASDADYQHVLLLLQ